MTKFIDLNPTDSTTLSVALLGTGRPSVWSSFEMIPWNWQQDLGVETRENLPGL